MADLVRLKVNNEIFSWAINRVGMSTEAAIAKFPKFNEWSQGDVLATVKQLKDFSHVCRFPFGYFFLENVPEVEKGIIPFFRSINEDSSSDVTMNIDETVAMLKDRQEWLSKYLMEHGVEKSPAVGKFKNEQNTDVIIKGIKEFLCMEDDWNTKVRRIEDVSLDLRTKLEDRNVIVVFNSVVGNNTNRPIPVKTCRGFCLVDDYAPFIFINSSDSKKAQLFTLLHELVHIFTSFSSGFGELGIEELDDPREALCDRVAAELLVPKKTLCKCAEYMTNSELSQYFKASEIVILRRKLDCGLISKSVFFNEYNKLPQVKKKVTPGGGNFYKTAVLRTNPKLLRCLNNALYERSITPLEAYRLAGVKGDVFTKLVFGESL